MSYTVTCEDYESVIGALPANTAATPYDVVISDGENLVPSAINIDGAERYVNISFEPATIPGNNLSWAFCPDGTTNHPYLVSCDMTNLDFANVTGISSMFYRNTGLKDVTISSLANVQYAQRAFANCSSLEEVSLPAMPEALNVTSMFENCSSLGDVSIGTFGKVTSTEGMFSGCSALTDISVSGLSNVINASGMFSDTAITEADVSELSNVTNATAIFYNCVALAEITVSTVNYGIIVGSLDANTAGTPYNIVIADGENIKSFGLTAENTERYVNLSFNPAVVPDSDLNRLFGSTTGSGLNYLISCDMSNLNLASVISANYMFYKNSNLTTVVLPFMPNLINARFMFTDCTSLTAFSFPAMPELKDAYEMFMGCTALASITVSNLRKLENANSMFKGCPISSIDITSFISVTDAGGLFKGCSALTTVDLSALSNATRVSSMFYDCTSLTSVDLLPLKSAINAERMFTQSGITSVNMQSMSNLETVYDMFYGCTSLQQVALPIMKNVTDASQMFMYCRALKSINVLGMENVIDATNMFFECTFLEEVTVPPAITNAHNMFYNCNKLATVKNMKWDFLNMEDMEDCFVFCSSLAHLYYYADDDPAIQIPSDDWLLYYKEGSSASSGYTLTAYNRYGDEVYSEPLVGTLIYPVGQTNALLFDTQPINCADIIKSPYLYGVNDGHTLDAAGDTFVLLAKNTNKVITNIFDSPAVKKMIESIILKPGMIQMYGGSTAPTGWLMCNGAEVSRTTYAALYAVIGNTYGTPSSNANFKLPDYREAAPVGVGQNERGITHDVFSLGEYKDDCLQNHKHTRGDMEIYGSFSCRSTRGDWDKHADGTFALSSQGTAYNSGSGGVAGAEVINFYASRNWTGSTSDPSTGSHGSVTRGKRLGSNFIIKY